MYCVSKDPKMCKTEKNRPIFQPVCEKTKKLDQRATFSTLFSTLVGMSSTWISWKQHIVVMYKLDIHVEHVVKAQKACFTCVAICRIMLQTNNNACVVECCFCSFFYCQTRKRCKIVSGGSHSSGLLTEIRTFDRIWVRYSKNINK